MCIIFIANDVHPQYPLIIASNRDEFLDRPTEPMRTWVKNNTDTDRCGGGDTIASAASSIEEEHNAIHNGATETYNGSMRRERRRPSRRVSLAGRDVVGGGTWLGIALPSGNDSGSKSTSENKHQSTNKADDTKQLLLPRWIAITNFREVEKHGRPSRGGLLMEYLEDDENGDGSPSAHSFVRDLHSRGHEYNGFNLLVGDSSGIYYYGNRVKKDDYQSYYSNKNDPKPLNRGIFGLSNGILDEPWPKVRRGKEMLRTICQMDEKEQEVENAKEEEIIIEQSSASIESFHEKLMDMLLSDTTQPVDDHELPNTGIDISSERYLSSIFVPQGIYYGKGYGTLSSTTIVVDRDGIVTVLERTWHHPHVSGRDQWFQFDLNKGRENDGTDTILHQGKILSHI